MQKIATVVTVVVGLLVAGIAPASANVRPVKGDTGAGISVSVTSVSGGSGGGSGGRPCTYQRANVPGDPSTELAVTPDMAPNPGTQEGAWYFYECQDPRAPLGVRGGAIFVPAGAPAVPPAVLAQEASRFLAAPAPGKHTPPGTAALYSDEKPPFSSASSTSAPAASSSMREPSTATVASKLSARSISATRRPDS